MLCPILARRSSDGPYGQRHGLPFAQKVIAWLLYRSSWCHSLLEVHSMLKDTDVIKGRDKLLHLLSYGMSLELD